MKRMWFTIRALACETLVGWAIWICPDDYCPSYVLAVIRAREGTVPELTPPKAEDAA